MQSSDRISSMSHSFINESNRPQDLNMRFKNIQNFPKYSKKFAPKLKKNGIIFETHETISTLIQFLMPFIVRDIEKLLDSYMDLYFFPACENIEENLGSIDAGIHDKIKHQIMSNVASKYEKLNENPFGNSEEASRNFDTENLKSTNDTTQTFSKRPKRNPVPKLKNLKMIQALPLKSSTSLPFSPKSPFAKSHQTRLLISRQSSRYKKLAYLRNSRNQILNASDKRLDSKEIYDFVGIPDLIQSDDMNDDYDQNDSLININPSLHLFLDSRPELETSCSKHSNNFHNQIISNKSITLSENTKFMLGSAANIWLGLGTARGRIYSKYPELFRYQCDKDDKYWLVDYGLLDNHRVRAYIMLYQEIENLRCRILSNDDVKSGKAPCAFTVPSWLMNKISNAFNQGRNQKNSKQPLSNLNQPRDPEQSTENTASLVDSPMTDFGMDSDDKSVFNFKPMIKMQ